MFSSASIIIN